MRRASNTDCQSKLQARNLSKSKLGLNAAPKGNPSSKGHPKVISVFCMKQGAIKNDTYILQPNDTDMPLMIDSFCHLLHIDNSQPDSEYGIYDLNGKRMSKVDDLFRHSANSFVVSTNQVDNKAVTDPEEIDPLMTLSIKAPKAKKSLPNWVVGKTTNRLESIAKTQRKMSDGVKNKVKAAGDILSNSTSKPPDSSSSLSSTPKAKRKMSIKNLKLNHTKLTDSIFTNNATKSVRPRTNSASSVGRDTPNNSTVNGNKAKINNNNEDVIKGDPPAKNDVVATDNNSNNKSILFTTADTSTAQTQKLDERPKPRARPGSAITSWMIPLD